MSTLLGSAASGTSGTVYLGIQLTSTTRVASSIRMKLIWANCKLAIVGPAGNSFGYSTDSTQVNTPGV